MSRAILVKSSRIAALYLRATAQHLHWDKKLDEAFAAHGIPPRRYFEYVDKWGLLRDALLDVKIGEVDEDIVDQYIAILTVACHTNAPFPPVPVFMRDTGWTVPPLRRRAPVMTKPVSSGGIKKKRRARRGNWMW